MRQQGVFTVSQTRQDDLIELSVRIERVLAKAWRLFGRYAYADNRSNYAELTYRRNEAALGLERDF